jgi:competence protein ComGC
MKYIKTNSGLTLMELIISIAMIGIIFIVLISALTTGYIQIIDMGKRTEARSLAQEIVEEINSTGTSSLGTLVIEDNLYGGTVGSPRYYINSDKVLTVVVYYGVGTRYVELSTIVP